MNRPAEKESGDKKEKSSGRKPLKNRRRGRTGGDDSSVDSKGNIRDLIDYEEEVETSEEESFDFEESETPSGEEQKHSSGRATKKPRRAALKAREKIRRRLAGIDSDDKKKKSKPTSSGGKRRPAAEESEEDDGSTTEESVESEVVTGRGHRHVSSKKAGRNRRVVESEEESSDEEEEEELTSDEDEDEDGDGEEDGEDDEDADEEDDEDSDGRAPKHADINIHIGSFGSGADDFMERMIPKRHNMKKEPSEVKKFVKLMTKPLEQTTIDDQIDEFKKLGAEKQRQMLEALERRPPASEESLMFKILTMNLPPDVQGRILAKYHSLQTMDNSSGEYFKLRNWLEKATSLPLGNHKEMPVRLDDGTEACTVFMERARRCLNEAIYGQEEAKLQILQFIATKISNPNSRGLSLLLVGAPGIGKTSLIKQGIAKALGWPFQFISLGGDSDATTYTGHQVVYEGSHSGKIANSLIHAKSMSMVLMFDELDKISTTPKGEEVQNMLIHLTDPVQNEAFEDKYLEGVPLDLSKVMFVFSANDIHKIDKVLLDRMMVVQLQGYNRNEKMAIAENFLLPAALREVNLAEKVAIPHDVVEHIFQTYASEETGVRELKRSIEQIVQKINMLRIFNNKELHFHIPNFQLPFVVKKQHIDLFLKKKAPAMDVEVQRMYA